MRIPRLRALTRLPVLALAVGGVVLLSGAETPAMAQPAGHEQLIGQSEAAVIRALGVLSGRTSVLFPARQTVGEA